MTNRTKRLTTLAALTAAAMLLSFVESLIPPIIPVPGVKLGLSNVATLFALYRLGWREAAAVAAVRVTLSNLLFGSASGFMYAAAGALLALVIMMLLKSVAGLSSPTVSVFGAVAHNVAQIGVSMLILQTEVVIYYLPVLIISGIVTGLAIGIIGSMLLKKLEGVRL